MIDLGDMAAFVAVLEAGNLSRAARARGVAQTTLARAVDRLEAQLGVQLLQRSTRSLRATAAGSLLLGRAREVLGHARELERELAELSSRPRGVVRLSLCSAYARRRLMPCLRQWIARNAEASVELRLEQELTDVSDDSDLAVRARTPASGQGVVTRLESYPHVLVAAPSYLARRGAPSAPELLAEHATLTLRTDRPWMRWPFRRAGVEVVAQLRPAAEVNDMEVLLELACAGAGMTVLPGYLVEQELARGALRALLSDWTLPRGGAYVIHAGRNQLGSAARDLLTCLIEETSSRVATHPTPEVA
jgi:DNA-binding transcriptional LysR family regulator